MLNNKKAAIITYAWHMWIKLIFTIVVVVTVWMIVIQGMKTPELSRELDSDIISDLVMYNTAIMTIDENTGRLYPGWVSLDKINQENIDSKIYDTMKTYDDVDYISMNISFYDSNENIIKSVYYREDNYVDNLVMVRSGLNTGAGGYNEFFKFYPIYYGKNKKGGIMKIHSILPN